MGALAVATRATPGRWVDTAAQLTPRVLAAVADAGYVGVFRYVPLPGNNAANDISGAELADILAAGLQCCLVQHVRTGPGGLWRPADHSGGADAQHAAQHAAAAGYPQLCHLFQDLEACDPTTTREEARGYTLGWGAACLAAGYRCGLYVGFAVPMSPDDLYDLPSPNCYWSDAGPRAVEARGFAIKQGAVVTIAGARFDADAVAPDALGGLPMVAGP